MASDWLSIAARPLNEFTMLMTARPKSMAPAISEILDSFVMVPSIILTGEAFRHGTFGALAMDDLIFARSVFWNCKCRRGNPTDNAREMSRRTAGMRSA